MIAVNAAAPTKNTISATNTQVMPLNRRRFFAASGALPDTAMPPNCCPKSPKLVPRRKPQFRQKRNSDGIAEWQLEQMVVTEDSGFVDISNATFYGLWKNIRRFRIRQM